MHPHRKLRALAVSALLSLAAMASPAFALNIVLSNDDGLTSNLKALYGALKAAGHDVIVSVPCSGQSGRGAAIVMYSSTTIDASNDAQISKEGGCHNGAAPTGAPAAGPFTKDGYTNGDFHYAHGTPVMATMYGLDVLAPARWGKAPDLVLSGPNEGQNVGRMINSSGTVGNVQFAAGRGIPAIALSAGVDTVDNVNLADPDSVIVAGLAIKLLKVLEAKASPVQGKSGKPILPDGVALNVNFPTAAKADTKFAFSRIGTFDLYHLKFLTAPDFRLGFSVGDPKTATAAQAEDESVVHQTRVSVTAMQVSFDHDPVVQKQLRRELRELFRE